MDIPSRLFVTGIGTDVGKSYATGWLARTIGETGTSVITQKFIQTGNDDMSEDIELHRRIMNIPLTEMDLQHVTAPEIFSYPCSPDLAAIIDKRPVDLSRIDRATDTLLEQYRVVIIEGAGGIMVPLSEDYLTIDYITDRHLPVVLVTNGKLGSVSDTLLAMEAIKRRNIALYAMLYNHHFDQDLVIARHTQTYLRNILTREFPQALWLTIPANLR